MTDQAFIKRMEMQGTRSNKQERVTFDYAKKNLLQGGIVVQPQLQLPLGK